MNLRMLQWLLAHRDLLTKVLEVVKAYSKDLPVVAKWEIVDKVARLIIPVLSESDLRALQAYEWDEDNEIGAFTLGAEYFALGLDWAFVASSLIPILRLILLALETLSPDE